ncbi:septation ring formation regulator EzrA [Halalkalibacter urbisdiaboli]|uniref:septation ring formation regulator EzrA n=1 Tax=Halalkalibacter urbisdiaboli TaxID=1960589 RepID=UPI000B443747|nr:septation ring formation regulator EzrA [Halalkalibacter urbisdiaboli]
MYLIYSVIAIIVIIFVIGVVMRRKIYKEVDRLEEWKNDILNRPIPNEIGKVKSLQMSGETEAKFELWRNDWDEIVGVILPDIEEALFDIEELAGKYRFNKAKQVISLTKKRMNGIEESLKIMIDDIEGLVESANNNRTESGTVREQFQQVQGEFLQKRGALGPSVQSFDQRLEEIKQKISMFDEQMEEGSYLQARELLSEVKTQLDLTEGQLNSVPELLIQLQSTLPADLKSLRQGMEEMTQAGYHLEPFSFEPRIEQIEKQLLELKADVIELESERVNERIVKVSEQIEQMYEALETEVIAKQKVIEMIPMLKEKLSVVEGQLELLIEETTHVQLSYRMSDEDLSLQQKIRKKITDLGKHLQIIIDVTENEKQTYTSIQALVNEWSVGIEQLTTEIEQGKKQLLALREDELKAKETLNQLRRLMLDSKRMVQKSNIPGLPQQTLEQLRLGEQKMVEASSLLEQVPLEMGRVTALVEEALTLIKENESLVEKTIEKAHLAERVIQYGNRYRSRSHKVQIGLLQAEQLFRDYEYDEAIECAARAVEPYEDNIVERVSTQMIS